MPPWKQLEVFVIPHIVESLEITNDDHFSPRPIYGAFSETFRLKVKCKWNARKCLFNRGHQQLVPCNLLISTMVWFKKNPKGYFLYSCFSSDRTFKFHSICCLSLNTEAVTQRTESRWKRIKSNLQQFFQQHQIKVFPSLLGFSAQTFAVHFSAFSVLSFLWEQLRFIWFFLSSFVLTFWRHITSTLKPLNIYFFLFDALTRSDAFNDESHDESVS